MKRVELVAFDEVLWHCTDQRIQLDIDNGVKISYENLTLCRTNSG